ncbi:hypothetical protein CVT24_001287 [Panaeolus cyanescens]|uniref:Uncharacterized protein n=1 Tax=Panaeolus cyanescens TaxID=181874 RepID=A0A409YYZ0_9AGAR|nr:hypothetical protein CVT24_001287 [Panaeolus cyanescens]
MAENMAPTRTMQSAVSILDHNNNSTFSTSSNLVPSTDHRPSKRLDLAALVKSKRHSTSPMKDRNQNRREEQSHFDFSAVDHSMKTRMQLISPPPEEDLAFMRVAGSSHSRSNSSSTSFNGNDKTPSRPSSNSKRKRNTQILTQTSNAINGESSTQMEPVEATPNPKPRKQGRHVRIQSVDSPTKTTFSGASPTRSNSKNRLAEPTTPSRSKPKNLLVQSPHHNNPEADYLPPLPALSLTTNSARRAVLGARRRSATPIPHYEPPTDVFTPPRQVFIDPPPKEGANRSSNRGKSAATSSRRKSQSAKKTTTLRISTAPPVVKLEMPDIDLSEPMPPPSPTDDPLLLSGPPEPPITSPVRPSRREASVQVAEIPPYNPRRISPRPTTLTSNPFPNSPPQPITFGNDLPPSSPEPPLDSEDAQAINDFTAHRDVQAQFESSEDSMMHLDDPLDANVSPVNLFNFDGPPDSGGWSDSDDDTTTNFASTLESTQRKVSKHASIQDAGAVEGEGEYTGRWRMMKVRTKMDPPSSATRVRMEDWGRPISPFPYPKVQRLSFLGEEEAEEEAGTQVEKEQQDQTYDDHEEEEDEEREVARLSMEPEELPLAEEDNLLDEDHNMADDSVQLESEADLSKEQEAEPETNVSQEQEDEDEEERQVREMSMSLSDDDDFEDEEEREVREMSMEITADEQQHDDDQPLVLPARIPTVPPPAKEPSPVPVPEAEEVQAQVQIPSHQEPEPEVQPKLQRQPQQDIPHFLLDDDSPMGQPLNEQRSRFDAVPEDDDADSTDSDDDPGLVKIISSDPRAAARAAAILKQHDYECYTKLLKRKHLSKNSSRHSFSFADADSIAKDARRRDLSTSGINKQRRRSTMGMGVLGDKVIVPGSPVKTLPELLLEAEHEISFAEKSFHAHEHSHIHIAPPKGRDPFKTPARPRLSSYDHSFNYDTTDGPRGWTKDEWKLLDACFTDQRLFLAEHLGLSESMAPVNLVNLEDVVQRFVDLVGGEDVVAGFGEDWDRESLLSRTQALQKKQKSGKVAPPTTPYVSPSRQTSPRPSAAADISVHVAQPTEPSNPLGGAHRLATMKVPDFTPLGRRATKPSKKGPSKLSTPILPEPVTDQTAPFSNLPPEKEGEKSIRKKIPPVLLAPRYSHLMEEAVEVSRDLNSYTADASVEGHSTQSEQSMDEGPSQYTESDRSILSGLNDSVDHSASFSSQHEEEDVQPQGMAKRVTGFLYSYLGGSKQTAPAPKPKLNSRQRGLPLPPRSVLEKPRGPVVTPARPLPEKGPAPKDLVNLHPAPLPKPSKLPTRREPKRLVDLHPAPPPVDKSKELEKEKDVLLRRRSSTSSVKDLIGGFEAMQRKAKEEEEARRKMNLKKMPGRGTDKGKPRWKF